MPTCSLTIVGVLLFASFYIFFNLVANTLETVFRIVSSAVSKVPHTDRTYITLRSFSVYSAVPNVPDTNRPCMTVCKLSVDVLMMLKDVTWRGLYQLMT